MPHVKPILAGWQVAQVNLHMKHWFVVFNSNGSRSGGEHFPVSLQRYIIRTGLIPELKLNGETPPPARDDRRRDWRSARFSTEQELIAEIDRVRLVGLGRQRPLCVNPDDPNYRYENRKGRGGNRNRPRPRYCEPWLPGMLLAKGGQQFLLSFPGLGSLPKAAVSCREFSK
jgi:hypothetical protein